MPLLFSLFLIPFVTSGIVFFLPDLTGRKLKKLAFVLSLIPLFMLVWGGSSWPSESFDTVWLPTLSIHFHLSIDNLSLLFLYLVSVIIPISILAPASKDIVRPNVFYGLILLLQALLIGFFTSRDLICFIFFFEGMLLPLYFLINIWGGPEREKASFTFIIYMIAGSVLTIAAALSLYFFSASVNKPATFDLDTLATFAEAIPYAPLVSLIFLLAFAVKTPLFPFHAWLPDAYCQAPTTATILLSALLSKAGVYGILRISFGLFPTYLMEWSPFLLALAIIGVLYGAFAAWGQNDVKRLIAYSSFSHVNFILAGLFVWNQMAQSGAILQAVNHAVTITGLFLVTGWLEMRLGTTQFGQVSGLAAYLPRLCWLSLFFVLSAIALPGLNNFVSEVMVLYGAFQQNWWLATLLGLTVILSVLYMLRWLQSVYFETPSAFQKSWVDIKGKEMLTSLPLIALIVWLGMYPAPVLRQVEPAAEKIITPKNQSAP